MADSYSLLVDQFGQPIPRPVSTVMDVEIAAPGSTTARPPFVGHLAFGINPGRLGALVRGADGGSTRDWFILAEEIEELFTHYSAVLSKRRRQVCLLPMTVEAAEGEKGGEGEKHADFVRKWLSAGVLERALYDITDAIGKGFSVNEIIWDSRPDGVWPAEILWRHQRDFEISWNDGETIWLRDASGFVDLAPHKFLLHVHKTKTGGPQRSGITRMIAWLWMYSTFTLKDWALFVQGYGLPVRLGRYGAEASEKDKTTLWRAVRGIAGDLAAIIPKSMEMEFVQAQGASEGAKLFTERANWLNYEVSKIVLGGTAGTDAISGGHAVGQEHRSAEQDVEKFDAMLIAGSVNRQIVEAMIAFTFGPQPTYPRIVLGQQEQVPLSDVIASIADLGPLGFKVKASELWERLQLTAPEGCQDDIIGPPPAPPGATNPDGSPLVKADISPKANPHPEINPNSDERALMTQQRRLIRRLRQAQMTAQNRVTPVVDALQDRTQREASGALAGMTAEIQECFDQAEDFPDLVARLTKLKLDDTAFATAMSQALAIANLAGRAELLDEIAPLGQA